MLIYNFIKYIKLYYLEKSIFVSYTGECLGNKAPLLKSLKALEEAAVPVCQYFDKEVTSTIAT